MSFCQLLKDQKFWTAEMLGYCPTRAAERSAAEQKDIRFGRSGGRLIALRREDRHPANAPRPRGIKSRRNELATGRESDGDPVHVVLTWPAVTPTITTMPAAPWCKAPHRACTIRSHPAHTRRSRCL